MFHILRIDLLAPTKRFGPGGGFETSFKTPRGNAFGYLKA
jgi:hypothetical protein